MRTNRRLFFQIIFIAFQLVVLTDKIFAQTNDPNPDSPTPVLISEDSSLRVLATAPGKSVFSAAQSASRTPIKIKNTPAFPLNERAVLFLTNVDLLEGEDFTAFRLNVEDSLGRRYRFPVIDLQPFKDRPGVFALTVELRDELGFYPQPQANGDVLVSIAWRGLESNKLRLGLGTTGGSLRDAEGMRLSPMPTAEQATQAARTKQVRTETPDAPDYVGYRYSGDRIRFLEQATFGPTAALDERVRRLGLRVWLAGQFEESSPSFPYPEFPLMPTNEPHICNGLENPNTFPPDPPDIYPHCRRDRYTMYSAQNWFLKEAFYGNAQLRHRVAWALSQMWVVSGVKERQSSHILAHYKVLGRNAFGNYRTLMKEMTLNATMGDYLDMARNTVDNLNENYAREMLQLFTIGLFKVNPNGTLQLDAENNPIPTYNQDTVDAFTKVFSGWSFCEQNTEICPNKTVGAINFKDPLLLYQNNHSPQPKILLDYPNAVNKNIAANLDGNVELDLALDNIYNHPNVAPFVSRFLIQNLVTSDPTPAYLGRVSAVFNANRTSPTQLKEVVKAILLDPEARGNQKTAAGYGKLREPVLLATNLLRQFKVQSADGTTQSDGYLANLITPMGQNIFNSPSVFNYYPPTYIIPGSGLIGPEFALQTTGTAINRTNFINTFVFNRVNVGQNAPYGTSINLSEMQSLAAADATGDTLLDALSTKMLHGTMSEQNRNSLKSAIANIPVSDSMLRARTIIYLIAASSKYQVQR